jgi:cell division transport system ATP-binding protein
MSARRSAARRDGQDGGTVADRVNTQSLLTGAEEPVVQFESVGMRYGLGPEVLSDVSFQIAPRSFQFLTGPSGAGKTTLLRLILLSVRPTAR